MSGRRFYNKSSTEDGLPLSQNAVLAFIVLPKDDDDLQVTPGSGSQCLCGLDFDAVERQSGWRASHCPQCHLKRSFFFNDPVPGQGKVQGSSHQDSGTTQQGAAISVGHTKTEPSSTRVSFRERYPREDVNPASNSGDRDRGASQLRPKSPPSSNTPNETSAKDTQPRAPASPVASDARQIPWKTKAKNARRAHIPSQVFVQSSTEDTDIRDDASGMTRITETLGTSSLVRNMGRLEAHGVKRADISRTARLEPGLPAIPEKADAADPLEAKTAKQVEDERAKAGQEKGNRDQLRIKLLTQEIELVKARKAKEEHPLSTKELPRETESGEAQQTEEGRAQQNTEDLHEEIESDIAKSKISKPLSPDNTDKFLATLNPLGGGRYKRLEEYKPRKVMVPSQTVGSAPSLRHDQLNSPAKLTNDDNHYGALKSSSVKDERSLRPSKSQQAPSKAPKPTSKTTYQSHNDAVREGGVNKHRSESKGGPSQRSKSKDKRHHFDNRGGHPQGDHYRPKRGHYDGIKDQHNNHLRYDESPRYHPKRQKRDARALSPEVRGHGH